MTQFDQQINLLFEPTGDLEKDYCAYCEITDKHEKDDILDGIVREELHLTNVVHDPKENRELHKTRSKNDIKSTSNPFSGDGNGVFENNNSSISHDFNEVIGNAHVVDTDVPFMTYSNADGLSHPVNNSVVPSLTRTTIVIRNPAFSINKRDMHPLAKAIPHCITLASVKLIGCGLSEFSYKLLISAVYKSCAHTLAVDMNPNGFLRDCTVGKREKNEEIVFLSEFRGRHLKNNHIFKDSVIHGFGDDMMCGGAAESRSDAVGKPKKSVVSKSSGGAANKKLSQAAILLIEQQELAEKIPIPLPTGWHAALITGIQVLSLRGNAITDEQVKPIAELLATNTDLLSLSLWGNVITCKGAAILAEALKRNTKLLTINLGHNLIGDEGVIAIASVLVTREVSYEELLQERMNCLCHPSTSGVNQLITSTTTLHPAIAFYLTNAKLEYSADLTAPYPTFGDICAAGMSKIVESTSITDLRRLGAIGPETVGEKSGNLNKKNGSSSPLGKGKKGHSTLEEIVPRLKSKFDCDVIRVIENCPDAVQIALQQLSIISTSNSQTAVSSAISTLHQNSRYRISGNTTLVNINMSYNNGITTTGAKSVAQILDSYEPTPETMYKLLFNSPSQVVDTAVSDVNNTNTKSNITMCGVLPSWPNSLFKGTLSRRNSMSLSGGTSGNIWGAGSPTVSLTAAEKAGRSSLSNTTTSTGIAQHLSNSILTFTNLHILNKIKPYITKSSGIQRFGIENTQIDAGVTEQIASIVAKRYAAHCSP